MSILNFYVGHKQITFKMAASPHVPVEWTALPPNIQVVACSSLGLKTDYYD
jgi:hypothetical protein